MDTNRLGRGEMIAAVSAILLLLIMFIFDWFGGENAWDVFGFIDIVLLITILAAIGLAVMSANAQSVNLPVALSAIVTALGALSILLVLYRILDTPDDLDRKIGVFLGLLALLGLTYGAYRAMQEEGTSFGAERDRFQDRDSDGPGSTGTGTGTGTGTTGTGSTGAPPPPPPPAAGGTTPPPPGSPRV